MIDTDIDIDFADPAAALATLDAIPAVLIQSDGRAKHVSGVYFQDIPVDPLDGMAVWDHKEAATRGYFKIDFLSNTLYRGVRDEAHLDALLNTPPPWHLLRNPTIVSQLHQLHNHQDVVEQFEPQSIEDLAVCLAIIRPGKRHLRYRPRFEIDQEIWLPTEHNYYKRSHAIAYAVSLVVQLNLLVEQAAE
jgi:hypothetical protein